MLISKLSFTVLPDFLKSENLKQEHRLIMSLFPEATTAEPRNEYGVLYRKEQDAYGNIYYIIQSNIAPDVSNIANQQLSVTTTLQTKEIENLYTSLLQRETFSYKIRINPVKVNGKKRIAVTNISDILEWWEKKAAYHGIDIQIDALSIVKERAPYYAQSVPISTVTIAGKASAHDRQKAITSIADGIGKEKSYGYGLLLLGS